MVIQHNLPGMKARRNADKNKSKLSKNLEKLSSGYRINRAGDDAAGLAISEGLRSTICGTEQAKRNILDGIGLLQTAEGAMEEISVMLRRGYELSEQSANGTYNETSRAAMQQEIEQIQEEIKRITDCTEFNGVPLLQSSVGVQSGSAVIAPKTDLPAWVKRGPSVAQGQQIETFITTESYTAKDSTGATVTGTHNVEHAASALDFSALTSKNKKELRGTGFYNTCFTCDNHYSIKFTTGTNSSMSRSGNHFVYEIGIDNVKNGEDLVKAVVNGIGGNADMNIPGNPLGHFTKLTVDGTDKNKLWIYDNRSSEPNFNSLGTSITWTSWTGSGAGITNTNAKSHPRNGKFGQGVAYAPGTIVPVKGDIQLQIGPSSKEQLEIILPGTHEDLLGIGKVSVLTLKDGNSSMEKFRNAVNYLSSERGRMGAYENGLEHTYRSLAVNSENLTQAESRIRDTDMADEITNYTKNNILLQAGQSMLAQANAIPQQILEFLR